MSSYTIRNCLYPKERLTPPHPPECTQLSFSQNPRPISLVSLIPFGFCSRRLVCVCARVGPRPRTPLYVYICNPPATTERERGFDTPPPLVVAESCNCDLVHPYRDNDRSLSQHSVGTTYTHTHIHTVAPDGGLWRRCAVCCARALVSPMLKYC